MARKPEKKRLTVTVDDVLFARVGYWADKHGVSMNEYILEAIKKAIAWENQDYPLPTLEQARLNQLIDQMAILSSNAKSLESMVQSGFNSLLGLARGDNYLLDEEDGEFIE